jgi:hypothetical protein
MNKFIFNLDINLHDDDKLDNLGNYIKKLFTIGTHYVIIKNNQTPHSNNVCNNIKELLNFYEKLNNKIGVMREIDKNKYSEYNNDLKNNYWVDVQYEFNIKSDKPWKSDTHLKLHTDNTMSLNENYAQITELVCIKPCKFSGYSLLINNNLVVEIIKYIDLMCKDDLFLQIYNREIYHSNNYENHVKNKILTFDEYKNSFIFSFNYTQALKSNKNSEEDLKIINKLNNFLEEKIMFSNLKEEIKLEPGDALLFNDELVLHGRNSVISNRHYKKTSIFFS